MSTIVEDGSSGIVHDVIDHGEVWTSRFADAGHSEEVQASRRGLQADDWTVDVPQIFEQRLRPAGS